ncbi:hypothetical protein MIDIC_350001 [Alphaproteobacteria bacterium]
MQINNNYIFNLDYKERINAGKFIPIRINPDLVNHDKSQSG